MQMRICGSRSAPRQKVSSKGESSTVRLLIASMHNTRYSCVVENVQRNAGWSLSSRSSLVGSVSPGKRGHGGGAPPPLASLGS